MTNYYLILRSLPFIIAAQASMFGINDWISVMIGPDCWDYSLAELGLKKADERYGEVGGSGQRYGVDTVLLQEPIVQSLRYAVSGVGVNILFLAMVMIYLAFFVPARDKRPPLALLVLDVMTFANATGSFQKDTAGHPRCLDDSVSMMECGKALTAFAPVVALDCFWLLVVLLFPGKRTPSKKQD